MKPTKHHYSLAKHNIETTILKQIIKTQARLAEANFDLDKFMKLVVLQMKKITPATGVVIELVEKDNMVYRAATGTVTNFIGLKLAMAHSISGLCVQSKKILQCDDSETDSRVNLAACRKVGARSMLVAPLFHQGNAIGVLKILSKRQRAFGKNDILILQLMAGFIGSALAHQIAHKATKQVLKERTSNLAQLQKAEKQLKQLAHYDFLTGLANRKLFIDHLTHSMTQVNGTKKIIALMYLDIDNFKAVNDTLGHSSGDELLKIFAKRLKNVVRVNDFVGRLSGDEFAIILKTNSNKESVIMIAKKILASMQKNFKLTRQTLQLSISIGITFYQGERLSSKELIGQADHALYQAKKAGKNNFKIYNN